MVTVRRCAGLVAGVGMVLALLAVHDRSQPQALAEPAGEPWTALFNGKDLAGWDVWLGRPKGEKEAIGLNQDLKKVFTVVAADGKPAIRISGEIPGAVTSHKEYENYHLRLEFKWGDKNWRANFPRDSGILYHCVGAHGVQSGNWMESLECEVMAGHCGDFYTVFAPSADVEVSAQTKVLPYYGKREFQVYQQGGKKITVGKNTRVLIGADHEKPHGQWNTAEVLTVGGTSVFLINGKVTMRVTNARRPLAGKEVPLTRGKIQLISEWSEVYYRNVEVRPLRQIAPEYFR